MISIPEIRFGEFSDSYKEYRLSELMIRYSENNKDEEFGLEDILSLSAQHGILNRKDLLEDLYEKVNHKNYIKTRLNDFVFGKSISTNYPFGLFKANTHKDGLLSTLYYTFKVNTKLDPSYLDTYFSYHTRVNNFLRKFVLVGDRYITTDPNFLLTGKIFIPPTRNEQEKISLFFRSVDERIRQLLYKKELIGKYKKGVVQQVFSGKLRFKNENGKPFPKWEKKILKEISSPIKRVSSRPIGNVMTISGTSGFMRQEDRFSQVIAADSISKYTHLLKEEFSYNRGNSKSYKYGCIFKLREKEALVPYVYHSFKLKEGVSDYFEQLFRSKYLDRQLRMMISSTARMDGLLNIGRDAFFSVKVLVPCQEEQKKIASFLTALDAKIESVAVQIAHTQTFKKGLLQQMFV